MRVGIEGYSPRTLPCITFVVMITIALFSAQGCGGGATDGTTFSLPSDITFRVLDTAGLPVAGATVYLVPVDAIDATPLSTADVRSGAAESRDEPLEDAVRMGGSGFAQGVSDAQGNVTLLAVPAGRYYRIAIPDAGDTEHLPGGTGGRFALDRDAFAGDLQTVVLSSRPGNTATYIGSSSCVACHAEQAMAARHAHKLGLSNPAGFTTQQDPALYPRFSTARDAFLTGSVPEDGTAVFFYDFNAARSEDPFLSSTTDPSPGGTVAIRAWLWRDSADNKFKITLENVANPADPRNGPVRFTLEMPLTYGGAVSRQAFLVRVPGRKGLYPLAQYHLTGDDTRYDWTRRTYRDLDLRAFWDAGAQLLKDPDLDATFEARCAGCHVTGYQATQDSSGEWLALAANDPAGVMDLNGDNLRDEINVGCESCHGPGSEHAAWAGSTPMNASGGRYIVSPERLSPSRQLVLCARCHDRVMGQGPVASQAPLDANGCMPRPGISRVEFLASHVSQKAPSLDDMWSQDELTRTEHHQAADLLRSVKHRNHRILVTCSDCHTNHGETTAPHQLLHDHTVPTGLLCFRCHNLDHLGHMQETTGSMHAGVGTVCTRCHMPNTGRGGAGTTGIQLAPLTGTMSDENLVFYRNDVSSHFFGRVPRKTHPDVLNVTPFYAMPIPFTDGCGTSCHNP